MQSLLFGRCIFVTKKVLCKINNSQQKEKTVKNENTFTQQHEEILRIRDVGHHGDDLPTAHVRPKQCGY